MKTTEIMKHQELKKQEEIGNARLIDTAQEGTCQLWEVKEPTGLAEYVVLSDNTVITREEDLFYEPIFPLTKG